MGRGVRGGEKRLRRARFFWVIVIMMVSPHISPPPFFLAGKGDWGSGEAGGMVGQGRGWGRAGQGRRVGGFCVYLCGEYVILCYIVF